MRLLREALSAECSPKGDIITLKFPRETIDYHRNLQGRIERRIDGRIDFKGPLLLDSKFALLPAAAQSNAMVLATWTCFADSPETPRRSMDDPKPAGRVLILDTALRAEKLQ